MFKVNRKTREQRQNDAWEGNASEWLRSKQKTAHKKFAQYCNMLLNASEWQIGDPLNIAWYYPLSTLNPFRMSIFRVGAGAKRPPLPKICHKYPVKMKPGTVIPHLKKIQKIYQSRDTHVTHIQNFFYRKSGNFVISRNTDIDHILIHNF